MREAEAVLNVNARAGDFPSFSEGLSLRVQDPAAALIDHAQFPFLFGGTFIEGEVI